MDCNRKFDRFQRILVLTLSGVLLSCGGPGNGGNGDGGNGTGPDDSNTAPTASIVVPSDGAVFLDTESVTFQGTATDAEDGALTGGSLAWSSSLDGAIGTGTQFSVDALSLTVGTHTITLTATDSGGAAATASISITVNQPPDASITAPSDGDIFLDTEAVTFEGAATDAQDGALTGESLVWSSDLDGEIGAGTDFTAEALSLSVGTHTITLTATDDDGASATPSISITVNQDLTPGSISGRVFRSQDDAPFEGVRLTRSGPDGNMEVVTDALGNYDFSDVPVGTHSVSVMSEDLPPFGSFVVSGEQQVTITGGLVADGVDFGFRVAEVGVRTIASVSSAGVGEEVEITVELDLTEIPLPMSGISGTIEWPTAVAGLVPGSAMAGDVWNDTPSATFLSNESPPGRLRFVGVSPVTGLVDDVFTVMTFRVTTVAAGSANFTPNLAELNVFDADTGVSTPLLDIAILQTTTATVVVQ